jgi:hypothetical protein
MHQAVSRTLTLAASTARDILRRPGGVVALLITSSLLILLPRLARRALDDGAALGGELILSTLALHAGLLGGLVAVHCGTPGSALGPVPEFLTTPLRWSEYVLARALGVIAATVAHLGTLSAIALAALLVSGEVPDLGPAALAGAGTSIVLQSSLFVAAGLCAGALFGVEMGTVAVVALMVSSRLIIPALTETGTAWTWLLPDPARVDVAREVALERPLGGAAWPLIWAATVLQCAGLLLAAYWRLSTQPSARATRGD